MYETFKQNTKPEKIGSAQNELLINNISSNAKALFSECGGYSFNDGLYRIHTAESSVHWTGVIEKYFPKYKENIAPFAYDWLGRQFTMDKSREGYLLMFDPATAEVFELQEDVSSFHNQTLVNERDSILSEQLLKETLGSLGVGSINYKVCIGHKVPLFLGGVDAIGNFEIVDLEVYWEITCQLYHQIKDLPPGTKINSIKFE
jgi:hypothetical protein